MKNIQNKVWLIQIIICVMLLSSCNNESPLEENLLSIIVKDSMNVKNEDFTRYREAISRQDVSEGLPAALFSVWGSTFSDAQSNVASIKQNRGVGYILYKVILIYDRVPADDSVSSYRYELEIKEVNDSFELLSIKESGRCWPDRGHQYFSMKEACT